MSLPQDGAAGVLGVTGVVVSFFSICVDTSFEGMRGHAHALSPLYAPGAGKEPALDFTAVKVYNETVIWDKRSGIPCMGVLSVILCIGRRQLAFAALFFCVFLGLTAVFWQGSRPAETAVFAPRDGVPVTVVIDPGHGGEDGGAVSPGGVSESHINLAISACLNDLLRFAGAKTAMTRTEDVSIHTEGDTMRARKVSDIHNRVELVNNMENSVLISIHQNSLPSSAVTHGAQVFWNRQEGAGALAESVQEVLNVTINTGNEKNIRRIPDTIYLMKHVTAPGILVECGFLSNSTETEKLQQPSYQLKLAAAIACGYLRCAGAEEAP